MLTVVRTTDWTARPSQPTACHETQRYDRFLPRTRRTLTISNLWCAYVAHQGRPFVFGDAGKYLPNSWGLIWRRPKMDRRPEARRGFSVACVLLKFLVPGSVVFGLLLVGFEKAMTRSVET